MVLDERNMRRLLNGRRDIRHHHGMPASIGGMFDAQEATPHNIDCFQQNKLRYVARDLHRLAGVPVDVTRRVLLARGVAKWMRNRQVMIDVKHAMKDRIKELPHGETRRELQKFYEPLQRAAKSPRWTLEAW